MGWGTVVAAVGSSLLGAGSSILGGNKAADASVEAAEIGAQQQRESLATALRLGRPQLEVGQSALGVLAGMFGLPVPDAVNFDDVLRGAGADGRLGPVDFDPANLNGRQRRAAIDFEKFFGFNPISDPEGAQGVIDRLEGGGMLSKRHGIKNEFDLDERGRQRLRDFQEQFGFNPLKENPALAKQNAVSTQDGQGNEVGNMPATLTDLITNNPGINFVREQGEQAIARGAAARGVNQSGSTLKDLTEFNSGLASTNFQNLVLSPLFQLAGFGNQQTAQQQQLVSGTGTNLANIALNAGNARASAYQNTGNVVGNQLGDISNLLMLKEMGAFS